MIGTISPIELKHWVSHNMDKLDLDDLAIIANEILKYKPGFESIINFTEEHRHRMHLQKDWIEADMLTYDTGSDNTIEVSI